MNIVSRFITAMVGITATVFATAATATAKVAPPEHNPGGGGRGTESAASGGFPFTTSLVALGICLAVLGTALVVRHVRATHRGTPASPAHA